MSNVVTTWPNGQVLTSSALTPDSIATIFQNLTLNIMGTATPKTPTDPAYQLVRIMWQPQGQPAMTATQNIVFIGARLKAEHSYGQVRDVQYSGDLQADIVYTRVWEVQWSIYGPNSFDTARLIKDALVSADWTRGILSASNLYLVPTDMSPAYLPEASPVHGQWWKRTDYTVLFNEQVNESITTGAIESSQIDLFSRLGEIEITVPTNA